MKTGLFERGKKSIDLCDEALIILLIVNFKCFSWYKYINRKKESSLDLSRINAPISSEFCGHIYLTETPEETISN